MLNKGDTTARQQEPPGGGGKNHEMAVEQTSSQHRRSWGALVSALENNTVVFHSQVRRSLGLVPGWRTAVAPTKLMRVTSEAPPDSRGMGCTRKCSSMSKMDWNHRCCTRHWPSSFRDKRRCCRGRSHGAQSTQQQQSHSNNIPTPGARTRKQDLVLVSYLQG